MRYYFLFVVVILFFACNSGNNKSKGKKSLNIDSLKNVVQGYDLKIADLPNKKITDQEIQNTINACIILGDSLKDKKERVSYFLKAANIAGSAKMAKEVKRSFESALSLENEPEKLALIHFQFGFISDEYLKQFDVAQREYEIIISDFGQSEWADDAKLALSQLGKTDEEILKELKAKNANPKLP